MYRARSSLARNTAPRPLERSVHRPTLVSCAAEVAHLIQHDSDLLLSMGTIRTARWMLLDDP